MTEIIGSVKLGHVFRKKDCFAVLDSFTYRDDKYIISVFSNWITDGASVPRLFWNIFPPIAGRYLEAAVLHDALYKSQKLTRKESDKIFLKAMKTSGVSAWKRWTIYLAVRCCGWLAWKKNKKNLQPNIVGIRRK